MFRPLMITFLGIGAGIVVGCLNRNVMPEISSAPLVKPYGNWESPITAASVAAAATKIRALQAEEDSLYWVESRPIENGRYVLVSRNQPDETSERIPASFNVRTRVHEYGGSSFWVVGDDIAFSNFSDNGLYVQRGNHEPERISISDKVRYADCDADTKRSALFCVREDHRDVGEPKNTIVRMDLSHGSTNGRILWSNSDFVAYPRLNKEGTRLTWLSWNHPSMPWDSVTLWVANIDADGNLGNPRMLNAGQHESVLQPEWSDDGILYFLTDRTGWWNLYRWDGNGITSIHQSDSDFGAPLWRLGRKYFALISTEQALVSFTNSKGAGLGILSLSSGELIEIDLPFVAYEHLNVAGNKAYFVAGRVEAAPAIVELNLETFAIQFIYESGSARLDNRYLSRGQLTEFETRSAHTAYAYYYPPMNEDFIAPPGEYPPLIVILHGGPTSTTSEKFNLGIQFWTSRGIAVLDVNHRGSSGYGREFRELLNGQWGVVEVQDAVDAARNVVSQNFADPERLIIRGGSSGGYSALSALSTTDVFAAGANYFGVSDLSIMLKDTHKFESHYLYSLIGPYPERSDLYRLRSPINNLDRLSSPLITFQGLEDRVVPASQSEIIYTALRDAGVPTAYLAFAGEQHGFRRAETKIKALEAELYFYGKVLGFKPAGALSPVQIHNLTP